MKYIKHLEEKGLACCDSWGRKESDMTERMIWSSILAWRIPWTEEPGGLQCIGAHRVGHDWSKVAHIKHLLACHVLIETMSSKSNKYLYYKTSHNLYCVTVHFGNLKWYFPNLTVLSLRFCDKNTPWRTFWEIWLYCIYYKQKY